MHSTRHGELLAVHGRTIDGRAAHWHSISVDVWIMNTQQAMEQILDLGVDGIMTDALRTLKAMLAARGRSLSSLNPAEVFSGLEMPSASSQPLA